MGAHTSRKAAEEGKLEAEEEDNPLVDEPCPRSLSAAAERGHAALVRELLAQGVSVEDSGDAGQMPLRTAARIGHLTVSQELLRAGASFDEEAFNRHSNAIAARAEAGEHQLLQPWETMPARHCVPPAMKEDCAPQLFQAIDIAPFVHPHLFSDAVRRETAQAWDETFRRVGFALIKGHNVSQGLIGELRAASRAFFRKSSDYKMEYFKGLQMAAKPGFSPVGVAVDHNDPVEGYTFIRHRSEKWSANEVHPPELGRVGKQYAYEMERVMHALHRMSAMALGLEPSYFDEYYTEPASVMVLSHYPPLAKDTKLRYRAHSDYSGFTVLLQDEEDCEADVQGGLEIDINGSWIPVRPQQGCFVVNIGDLFETWTNDRWRSTPHRVRSPPPGSAAAKRSRFSTMLFSGPNLDSIIAPIRTCVDAENPLRYAPVSAADHLRAQYNTKSKEAVYKAAAAAAS